MRGGIGLMMMRWRDCRGGSRVGLVEMAKMGTRRSLGGFFCLFILCDDGMMR